MHFYHLTFNDIIYACQETIKGQKTFKPNFRRIFGEWPGSVTDVSSTDNYSMHNVQKALAVLLDCCKRKIPIKLT